MLRSYSWSDPMICPGLVKPILRHNFGRSWYMRLFHTPRTSFLFTTRLWKHNSCSGFFFYSRKELEGALSSLLEFASASVFIKVPHEFKTSMNNFDGFSLPNALLVFTGGWWRQGLLCVIQSLPHPDFECVTRFAEWFRVRPSFLFSPLPHLKSPLP